MITTPAAQVPARNLRPARADASRQRLHNRQTHPALASGRRIPPFGLIAIVAMAGLILEPSRLPAQESGSAGGTRTSSTITARKPVVPVLDPAAGHPLEPVLQYARQRHNDVKRRVRDYTCRLVKRERIDGLLQEYQYIDMWVREGSRNGKQTLSPMGVLLEYLAPLDVKGRKVLYVENQNDDKLLVRRGGKRYAYVVTSLDPRGNTARHESIVPVTEVSYDRLIGGIIKTLEKHFEIDPSGTNTQVQSSANAKVNERPCQVIRVVHPALQEGLTFHIASVYVDTELQVPVRIEAYGWPDEPGTEPPLLGEYTYGSLTLNANLSNDIFQPELLRSR